MQVLDSSGNFIHTAPMIIFPGQGVQSLGMGSEVFDISAETKAIWDCASDVSGIDVRKLCMKGPMPRLTKTRFQQLAITTVNTAMFTAIKSNISLENAAFAGHSIGEYSALYAAGVYDLETLFKAVNARAEIMQTQAEKNKGSMYVIKEITHEALSQFLHEHCQDIPLDIAVDNSHRQQVLAGETQAMKIATNRLAQKGYQLVKLPVNGAWHCRLMGDGVPLMRETLANLPFSAPQQKIYINRIAKTEYQTDLIKEHLAHHLTDCVRWRESMEQSYADGYRHFLEIGNKKVLSHLLHDYFSADSEIHISHFTDWSTQHHVEHMPSIDHHGE